MSWLTRALGIDALIHRSDEAMAKIEEVNEAINNLTQHVTNEAAQVSAALKSLADEVDALRVQVATGGAASALELDGVVEKLKGITASVDAIIPDGAPETQGGGGPGEETDPPGP